MNVRQKNALTKYEISATVETPEWLQLGKWINNIDDETEDVSEDFADYAGDGNISIDITGISEQYKFDGTFDATNEAMAYLKGLRRKKGEERQIGFRITDPDGATHTGKAVVSGIVYRGGEASAFPVFGCSIRFVEEPITEEGV